MSTVDTAPHDRLYHLNFTEQAYLTLDPMIGSMNQTYLLRLDAPIEPPRMRAVLRELLSAHPRLRGITEPGWKIHGLRILPDGPITDQLFEHAWLLDAHTDPTDEAALQALHQRMLNDMLPIGRGLACRFRFLPHAQHPVLFVSFHHLLVDGRTIVDIFGRLMARLNGGGPMPLQAVEDPSLLDAVRARHWWQIPGQIWLSRRHARAQAALHRGLNVQQVVRASSPFMSTHALLHYRLPVAATVLRPMAKSLGLSLNGLITLMFTEVFLEGARDDPKAAALIRNSVDLRRFYPKEAGHGPLWGNHVGAFVVTETGRKSLRERAASVKAQSDEFMARFQRREVFWLYLLYAAMPWLGQTLAARLTTLMMRRHRYQQISAHATNLGRLDAVNPAGATVRLTEVVPAVPSLAPIHPVVELGDRLTMPVMWQRSMATPEHMQAYLARFDRTVLRLVAEARREGLLPPDVQAADPATDPATDQAAA